MLKNEKLEKKKKERKTDRQTDSRSLLKVSKSIGRLILDSENTVL